MPVQSDVEEHPLDIFLNTGQSTEGFFFCVCVCLVGGSFSEAFTSWSSPSHFLPISLQAERKCWDMVFLPKSSLPGSAMTSTKTITTENGGWRKCIFSWVWGFILVLFLWLVSSVTRTVLCIAGFTVAMSASCTSSPMQGGDGRSSPCLPSPQLCRGGSGHCCSSCFSWAFGLKVLLGVGIPLGQWSSNFFFVHPYLQNIGRACTSNVCVYSYL